MNPTLTDAALTDTGRVREHNEDTIGSDPELGLYVLADGMGGYNAGEVASGLAVKTVLNHVRDGFLNQNVQGIDRLSGLMRPTIVLRDALLRANKIVHLTSKSQPHCEGMGTTVVAAMFFKDRLITAHVGDSRVYRIRNGVFEQITNDHSLLQELVDRGFYTPEEAATSTNKNYVTRALGVESTVEVEVREHPIAPGDLYLLCSDGLSDMLSDAEIKTGLLSGASLAETAQRLVEHANAAGGRDNISVVLARVDRLIEPERSWADRIRGWFR
jgi:PPM family protein phosphatase